MKKILKDLKRRISLNRDRLSDSIYQYTDVFTQGGSWPGDFEGRDVLALTSLYHALDGYKEEQENILEQLKSLFDHIPLHTNAYGYFGEAFNGEYVDEQQVSGNSWYLRGLIEYYYITKDEKYLHQIQSIVKQFLVPIAPFYDHYPTGKRERGGVGGKLEGSFINGWKSSTDVGCAFIMMDGMTKAYEVTHNEDLKKAIEKIIENFLTIDYVNLECQTHATLSCARGILRFYRMTKNDKYLKDVERIFSDYLQDGMTYDYSNINWFKREDTWTEPCCIVDSLILTKELYLITNKKEYLDLFNRIYTNSIRTFQRNNGGAGCATCAIHSHYDMKMFLYEAFFCCTMRLGNGLGSIADFTVVKKDNQYFIPFTCAVDYEDEEVAFLVDAEFYEGKRIQIEVKKASNAELFIRLPENAKVEGYPIENGWLHLSLNKKEKMNLFVSLQVKKENGLHFYGDMLLTRKDEVLEPHFLLDNQVYSYLYDSSLFTEEELKEKIQYVK